ncbi:KxYKxGKxW signal peptide domain-containing protein [Leuconostoc sp. JNUCC 76]
MQNSKTYKLYKSGKLWVIGAVAVAGVAVSANTTQVSADTVSTSDAQAVKTTDTTQDDSQVQLTASSADTTTDTETTDADATTATASSTAEKSTVPTTSGTSFTQDQASDAIDKAQDTVKDDAKVASDAGVDVTTGATTDVTINDDNASSKTDEVLSDLNKQDQAVKDATATQQANDQAYQTATTDQQTATTQGQADLDKSTTDLNTAIDIAKQAGIDVSVGVSETSPEYKSLTGLEGQDLLDAMAYNIDLYKKAVTDGVATQDADTATLTNLTAEYQKQVADYEAQKVAVDKANADKKAAYDEAVAEFEKAVNAQITMSATTQTDADSGQYKTFMTASVDQTTGEFTLEHDMNDGVNIIGHGVLTGKINWTVVSNGDGSETVTISSIELYSYTYTNYYPNQAANQDINFHVYNLDGNELFSVYHDGNTTFTKTINSTTAINKTFTLAPNETSSSIEFLTVDDNWVWDTHGQVTVQIKNTNVTPALPEYESEPTAPVALTATVHNVTVADMPTADKPTQQKVAVHYYNIKKTPKVEKTSIPAPVTLETPATPKAVETASILPHTNAKEQGSGAVLGIMASIASLGLLGAMSKKFKKQN